MYYKLYEQSYGGLKLLTHSRFDSIDEAKLHFEENVKQSYWYSQSNDIVIMQAYPPQATVYNHRLVSIKPCLLGRWLDLYT